MGKGILKRAIAMLLTLAIFVGLMPQITLPVHAATLDSAALGVPYLTMTYETKADNDELRDDPTFADGKFTTQVRSDKSGNICDPVQTEIKFTSSMPSAAVLTFKYDFTNPGNCTIDGKEYTSAVSGASASINLSRGGSTTITVESSDDNQDPTKIVIYDIRLSQSSTMWQVNLLTNDDSLGTVSGSGSYTAQSTVSISATANPESRFLGWFDASGNKVSSDNPYSFQLNGDTTYTAYFLSADHVAYTMSDTMPYLTLEEAVSHAAEIGGDTVVLLKDYTLTESLEIPSGVTVLVPYSDSNYEIGNMESMDNANSSYYDGTPDDADIDSGTFSHPDKPTTPPFRTLTVVDDVTIDVASGGRLVIGGQVSSGGGGNGAAGKTDGAYAHLVLGNDSAVNVNGGILATTGYITGGSVNVNSGSLYEPFLIMDFNGGTYTAVAFRGVKVTPFHRMAVINVDSDIMINTANGGAIYGYGSLVGGDAYNPIQPKVVASSGALLNVGERIEVTHADPTGIKAQYPSGVTDDVNRMEPYIGKTTLDIYGGGNLGSMSVKYTITLETNEVPFALSYNFDVNIKSGTFTVANDAKIMPGAVVTVDPGAKLVSSKLLMVSDGFTEKMYANTTYPSGSNLAGAGYSERGRLIVNGELEINGGTFVGTAETTGATGVINVASGVKLEVNDFREGALPGESYTYLIKTFTIPDVYNSATLRSMKGRLAVLNGSEDEIATVIDMVANTTYYANNVAGKDTTAGTGYTYKHKTSATATTWTEVTVPYTNTETLSGQWTKGGYLVEFYDGEGSKNDAISKAYAPGTAVPAPDDYIKAGYTFNGFTDQDGNTYTATEYNDVAPLISSMPNKNLVLTAQSTPNTNTPYKVEVYQMGLDGQYPETPDETLTNLFGVTDTTASYTPEAKEGFTVSGDSVLSGTITGDGNMALKIYYQRNQYTLTVDDGVNEPVSKTYYYGEAVESIATPTKEHSTFLGWEGLAQGESLPVTMPAKDVSLIAQWKGQNVNVNIYIEGAFSETISNEYGKPYIVPTTEPTKAGYDFAGWSLTDGGEPITAETEVSVVEMHNLYAVFTPRDDTAYTVKTYVMDLTGNYVLESTANEEGTTDTTATVTPAAREGFTLDNAKSKLSGTVTADGQLVLNVYYARNQHTLKTVIDGQQTTTTYYYGANVAVTSPAKTGHTFTGWQENGAAATVPATMPARDVTLTAVFSVNSYQLTWNLDGGTITSEAGAYTAAGDVPYGTAITAPAVTKTGHTFTGWSPAVAAAMGATDAAYTAQWQINSYTVTWDIDGSTTTETYTYGAKINKPGDPIKTGYTFIGWEGYTDGDTMGAGNVTYTARWRINSYDVKWYVDGELKHTDTLEYASEINGYDYGAKVGYTFSGWHLDEACTQPAGSFGTVPEGGKSFYGKWNANSNTPYTVKIYEMDTQGNYPAEPTSIENKTGVTDSTADYTPAGKVGFTVDGNSVLSGSIAGDGQLVLTVYYKRDTHTVHWMDDDKTGTIYDQSVYYGGQIAEYEGTRPGYTLSGWKDTNDQTVSFPQTMGTADVTYYAVWSVNNYDVVWMIDGVEAKRASAAYGSNITAYAPESNIGYTFDGWYSDPDCTQKVDNYGTVPVDGITFYGKWNPSTDTGYTVKIYEMNTAGNYPANPTRTENLTGTTAQTATYVPADKTGFVVADDSVLEGTIAGDGSLVLTVKYERQQYTLTTVVDGVETPVSYYYQANVMPIDDPSKDGYAFAGWTTNGATAYVPAVMPAEDVTLTATWTPIPYQIQWVIDGNVAKTEMLDFASNIAGYAYGTKAGYTFDGWYADAAYQNKLDSLGTVPVNGTTFYGKWNANENTPYTVKIYEMDLAGNYPSEPAQTVNLTGTTDTTASYTPDAKTGFTSIGASGNIAGDGSLVLDVYYRRNQYTVTWMDEDGTTELFEQDVFYGGQVTSHQVTREGYTFQHWADANDDEVEFPQTMGAENVTYTAVWQVNSYDVKWYIDGALKKTDALDYNTAITAYDYGTKAGYTFDGWYADDQYNTKLNDLGAVPVSGRSFYGRWIANADTPYTVEIYVMDTDGQYPETATQTLDKTGTTDTDASYSPAAKIGFTVSDSGEYTSVLSGNIAGDGSLVLKVYYQRNQYTLKTVVGGNETLYTYYYEQSIETIANPVKEGHSFTGWTESGVAASVPGTMPARNVTLTAGFSINSYTLAWNPNGGTITSDAQDYTAAGSVVFGTDLTAPTVVREGYTFAGWSPVLPDTMGAADVTYIAQWTVNSYQLTWDTNEGTITSADGTYTPGGRVAFGTPIIAPQVQKEGHTFAGWQPSVSTNMGASDITYVAQWTVNDYTLNWNLDGGIITSEDGTYTAAGSIPYGSAITAPVVSKAGYTFAGWSPAVPGTMGAANVTYTATWTAKTDTPYTVEYYRMDTKGNYPVNPTSTEDKTGTTGADTAALGLANPETGFAVDAAKCVYPTISGTGDTVVKIYYSRNTYTVTWIKGENDREEVEYKFGAAINLPEQPTKTGYTFTGWSPEVAATMPAEDLTYTANWQINTYTVTWNVDGVQTPVQYTYGTPIAKPEEDPVKTGYTFTGWDGYTEGATMGDGNVTYTALWTANVYQVNLNANEGVLPDGVQAQIDVIFGQNYPALPVPSRIGYGFMGWYIGDTDAKVETDTKVSIADGHELKAAWDANSTNYTVHYYVEKLDEEDVFEIYGSADVMVGDFGTQTEISEDNAKQIPGFTFLNAENTTITEDDTDIVKVYYTRNSYTLSWDLAGGSASNEYTPEGLVKFGAEITAPVLTKEGHDFEGWSPEVPATMPAADASYTAQWELSTYTIYFVNGESVFANRTGQYTKTVNVPSDPVRTGYTFAGWYTDVYDEATKLTGDTVTMPLGGATYYAKWQVNYYQLIWDANGGSIVSADDDYTAAGNVAYGSALAAPQVMRDGYTFAGWTPAVPATMGAAAAAYKATWTPNTYSVQMDLGTGGTAVDEESVNIPTQTYDETSITLPAAEDVSKTGYTLSGWTANETTYAPGATIETNLATEGTTTITANWDPNQYKIVFNGGSGTSGTMAAMDMTYDTADELDENAFTKPGYHFVGWTTVDPEAPAVFSRLRSGGGIFTDGQTVENLTAENGAVVNLYANWELNTYTVVFNANTGTGTMDVMTFTFGEAQTLRANSFQKTGYHFTGWNTSQNGTGTGLANNQSYTITDPDLEHQATITLYAQWAPNTNTVYKVKHHLPGVNGGEEQVVTISHTGTTDTTADAPVGSYTGFTAPNQIQQVTIAADGSAVVDYYYTRNSYTVTWSVDGETDTDTYQYGAAIVKPEDPAKVGHTFAGWGSNVAQTMPAQNLTYTAQWTVNEYTVTWDVDGETTRETYDYGAAIAKPANPTKTGYTFAGWTPAVPATMGASDATYTATWTVNNYTVTWDVDGETTEETYDYGETIEKPENPTKVGYTFAGWSPAVPATMGASDAAYTATWTINKHYVTWIVDGVETPVECTYGQTIMLPTTPTKEGYTFSGWTPAVADKMPDQALTYTATWTINEHTVTWMVDGEVYDTDTLEYGQTIAVPTEPTKEGHTFVRWDGYTEGAKLGDTDVTYTAVWSVNTYYVTWDVDGQTTTHSYKYGATIIAPDDPSKEGHEFDGWDGFAAGDKMGASDVTYTAKWKVLNYTVTWNVDGVKTVKTYAYGADIEVPEDPTKTGYTFTGWTPAVETTMGASNVTYTATWTINSYTVTWDVDGEVTKKTYEYGASVTRPADPTKTGYTFDGWSPAFSATMGAADVTYTATWKINSYTVTWNVDGETDTDTYQYGAAIVKPEDPVKVGYTFAGWGSDVAQTMPAQNLTYTAQWTVNSYTVTWDVDGETTEETYDYGQTIVKPANPAKTGYTFAGWAPTVPATMGASDATYTATWTVNNYTVTWDVDGETTEETYDYGQAIVKPANPTKVGYTFAGWSPVVPATMGASDAVYTATWTINRHNVTWIVDGVQTPVEYAYGQTITLPTTPTKEGYTFAGWTPAVADKMPDQALTYTATWTINAHTVTWMVDGEVYDTDTLEYGQTIALPDEPAKEGHTFDGWTPVVADKMPDQDLIYTAVWTVNEYTVTWNVDGVETSEEYAYGQPVVKPINPTKEGYTFDGWTPVVADKMPAQDLTYTATWTINEYQILWTIDGSTTTTTYEYGQTIQIPAAVKEGYTFTGWDAEVPEKMPAGDLAFTAQFRQNTYTVRFLANGGAGEMADKLYTYDSPGELSRNSFSRTGHTFTGWNTQANGSGISYTDGQAVWNWTSRDGAQIELYAQWQPVTRSVTFFANGGNGAMEQLSIIYDDPAKPLPDNQFVRNGYTFTGWNTASDGFGTAYAADAQISNLLTNLNLYAQWQANGYEVVFDGNGGEGMMYAMGFTYGQAQTLQPNAYTMTGYSFNGWNTNADGSGYTYADEAQVQNLVTSGQITLYAQWKINTYRITFDSAGGSDVGYIEQNYDTPITAPADPTRQSYQFVTWDQTIPQKMPAQDMTITAQWISYLDLLMQIDPADFAQADSDPGHRAALDRAREYYNIMKLDPEQLALYNSEDPAYVQHKQNLMAEIEQVAFLDLEYSIECDETINDVNDLLYDSVIHDRIATIDVTAETNRVEASLDIRDYLAMDMIGIPFLTKLFRNQDIWSIHIPVLEGQVTESGAALTPYGNGVASIDALELMLRVAFAVINEPEITGVDHKMTFDEFVNWLKADEQQYSITIGILDGKNLDVILNAVTPEGIQYKTQYNISFYNKHHDVTWNVEGNQTVETYAYGDTIVKKDAPTKTGYTFTGWQGYTDGMTMGKQDLSFTAGWQINQYTVSFDSNGGTDVASITQDYNSVVYAPTAPTKTGHRFDGWYAGDMKVTFPLNMPVDGMSLTAKWTANDYTITFNSDGGTGVEPITQAYGTEVAEPAQPAKTGYTFAGWYADDEKVTFPLDMPLNGLQLKAKWDVNKYTITFVLGNGQEDIVRELDYNSVVSAPADPTREGYTFRGWNAEIPAYMPAEDLVITALWDVNQYTVTFMLGNGQENVVQELDYGAAITAPAGLTKTGHTFAGWDSPVPAAMPAQDLTITAQWTPNTYTVTLDAGEGSVTPDRVAVTYGQPYELPVPQRDGYTFDGWFVDDEPISATVDITADATFTAKWTLGNPYNITYVLDSGAWSEGTSPRVQYTVETDSFTLPQPVREGYSFAGWTGTDLAEPTMTVTVAKGSTGERTYTATWTVNSYTITWVVDGEQTTNTYAYGDTVSEKAAPAKEGYTFDGWDAEVPAKMPAQNLIIAAKWSINQYTVTFVQGNGQPDIVKTQDYGTVLTAPADPSREGYTFAGWDAEVPAKMPAGDMTITAKWDINQYTITFVQGNGQQDIVMTQNYGSTITAPADPTREGFTFDGWDKRIPGQMGAEDMTITAQWNRNNYTVTWIVDGKQSVESYAFEAAITAPAPTKEGYTFDGWDAEVPANMPARNLTFTARWEVNEYTLTIHLNDGTDRTQVLYFGYGENVSVTDPSREGHTFTRWNPVLPETMPARNLEVTALWEANPYTITYYVDGVEYKVVTLLYGSLVVPEEDPVKDGYTFSGWSEMPVQMPAQNLEVDGSFTSNVYELSYDLNYAAAQQPEGKEVTFDAAYGELPEPARTGYTFDGWYLGSSKISAASLVKTADNHTLVAKWTANTYKVTLDPNGGQLPADNTITVSYDGTYAALPEPAKTGYDFIGWFDGQTQISKDTKVTITADQNLVAQWKVSGNTPYTVNHYQMNVDGNGYTLVKTENLKGAADTQVQASQTAYEGFTFNADKSVASGLITADGALVLDLYYDRVSCDVVWYIGNNTVRQTYLYGQELTIPETDREEDVNASYTFTGWNVEPARIVTGAANYTAQYELYYEAMIGKVTYRTLALALENAKAGEQVVLARDITLTEDITVPAKVTLLLPCKDEDPGYVVRNNGKMLVNHDGTSTAGTAGLGPDAKLYRKLTIPAGVTMNVEGTVLLNSVSGRPGGGYYDQDITGGYAQIDLDGNIAVKSGGILDCFGFIKGTGKVNVNSGGRVTDMYIVRHWRGGTQGLKMYEANVYPMNEYDCHNIETDVVIQSGGALDGMVKMYAGSQYNYTRYPQVDNANGLIRLDSNAYLVRSYENGREVYRIYGGADFSRSTLNIVGVDLTTAEFIYPIDGDIDMELHDGRYDFTEDYKFMPGASLLVGGDAHLYVNAGKTVVFYHEFHDLDNTSSTEYPERDPAVLTVKEGGKFTNAGVFAGDIYTESADIFIGTNPQWTAQTREANGYASEAIDRGEETWRPIDHTLSIVRPGHTWHFGANQSIVWDGMADYSAVQQAVASIPEDLDYYVSESTVYIQPALDQVVYGLTADRQAEVDAMVQPILDAVAALQLRQITVIYDPNGGTMETTAYSVDCIGTYGKLPRPTREFYEFMGWYTEDGQRVRDNDALKSKTDLKLIARWQLKDADYAAIRKVMRSIPSDAELAKHSDESVAALRAAIAAIDYTLKADRQAEVDAMAQAVTDALNALQLRKVQVILDADGGNVTPAVVEVTYTQTMGKLPTPEKEGHSFLGWFDAQGNQVNENTAVDTMDPITLTARWSINSYTVTWDVDGVKNASVYRYGAAVQIPTDPVKTGYTFTGWTPEVSTVMGGADVIYTATWKINQYTITFDTDGGSALDPITQDYGTEITAPADPTRTGYTFLGWDTQIPAQMPAGDVTIKALWKVNSYTIVFYGNGGTDTASIVQDYGTQITPPADPTKTGYRFAGWTPELPAVMPAQNLELTAQWEAMRYTIHLDTAGGTMDGQTVTVTYDQQYNIGAPTREGYTFVGWYLDDVKINSTDLVKITEDGLTLKAKWEVGAAYSITYDLAEGAWQTGTDVKEAYNVNTETFTLPVPVRTGYTFAGWIGTYLAEPTKLVTVAKGSQGERAYTATWSINSYTVTWDVDGETVTDTYQFGAEVVKPADPVKTGYTFAGWTPAVETAMGAADVTYTATWNINSYTVTWDVDGVISQSGYEYGASVIKPADPAKTGYTFAGWSPAFSATMGAADVTYTATWTVNRYTITFDTVGGSDIEAMTYDYGAAVTAPEDPVRANYIFAGWDTEIPQVMPDQDLTITAKWKPIFEVVADENKDEIQVIVYDYAPMDHLSLTINDVLPTTRDVLEAPVVKVTIPDGFILKLDLKMDVPHYGNVLMLSDGTILPNTIITETGVSYVFTESTQVQVVEKSLSFPDIPDDFWAANEIAYMTSRGYLAGKLDGTYNSTEALTRGMVALVLWRLAGQPEPQLGDVQVFPDVKTGTRYSKAIAWAAQEGVKVVSGYPDGTFRPDAPITRLHLTAMLDRYMTNVAGYALPEDASKDVTQFNDYDRISQSLVDSANWAYRTGILAGRTGNLFDPNGNASRGQMAVIMCRLMQKYNICLTEDMIAQVTQ